VVIHEGFLSALRKTGPFPNDVVLADAGLQLVLTGRRPGAVRPVRGGALGVAIGARRARLERLPVRHEVTIAPTRPALVPRPRLS